MSTLEPVSNMNDAIKGEEVDDDQSVYGLLPPELVLTVQGSFGKRVVSFGKVSISGKRYAQAEGDQGIYLVTDSIFKALKREG